MSAIKSSRRNESFRIVTYNILSSHLSAASWFPHCQPENCDPDNRYDKVIEKLEEEIRLESIICLQEVSELWLGRLHCFFSDRRYYLVNSNYGTHWNGHMGVAIAIPLSNFDIIDVNIERIALTKKYPIKPKESNGFFARIINYFTALFVSFCLYWKLKKEKENFWWDALNNYNKMVCVRLKSRTGDKEFVVGNYHMPCKFTNLPFMSVHASLSAKNIHKFANGTPYIFAGDFNLKPCSAQYDLLTTGKMDPNDPNYPTLLEHDHTEWTPDLEEPLVSAYKEYLGHEPEYTNYAQTKFMSEPFIDALDYIFLSTSNGNSEFAVRSITFLPSKDEALKGGPYPDTKQPSDHLLLSADLSIL